MDNRFKNLIFAIFCLFQISNVYAGNWYQNRLNEFNIRTPEIKWGYPINYDLENENIRGVILLTNEQSYLERLNTITYVGAPTIENAKIIANVLPDFENPFPIYYVAVDSSVVQYELTEFLEELVKLSWEPEIRFIGEKGNYLKLKLFNERYLYDRGYGPPPPGIYVRNQIDILINSKDEILFEERPISKKEVGKNIIYLNQVNFSKPDVDLGAPNWQQLDINYLEKLIEDNEASIVDSVKMDYQRVYLEKLYLKLELVKKFGNVRVQTRNYPIYIKYGLNTSLMALFELLEDVHKAFYILRNDYSKKMWNINYQSVLRGKDIDRIKLLEFIYPVLIVRKYNEVDLSFHAYPPPPPLSQ